MLFIIFLFFRIHKIIRSSQHCLKLRRAFLPDNANRNTDPFGSNAVTDIPDLTPENLLIHVKTDEYKFIATYPVSIFRQNRKHGTRCIYDQPVSGLMSVKIIHPFQTIDINICYSCFYHCFRLHAFQNLNIPVPVIQGRQHITITHVLQTRLTLLGFQTVR